MLPSLFTVHQDQQALALCCLVCGARARAPSHSPVPGEETSRGAASVLVIALPLPLSLSHVTRTPLSLSRFGFILHLITGRAIFFSHGLFAGFEFDGTDNAAVLDASRPLVMQSSAHSALPFLRPCLLAAIDRLGKGKRPAAHAPAWRRCRFATTGLSAYQEPGAKWRARRRAHSSTHVARRTLADDRDSLRHSTLRIRRR